MVTKKPIDKCSQMLNKKMRLQRQLEYKKEIEYAKEIMTIPDATINDIPIR